MAKTHASLSPKTNMLLIPLWAAIAAGLLIFTEPRPPIILAVVGAIFGAILGAMQHLSLKQASNGFSAAASLMDVRRAFMATTWGRRYITSLYVSKGVLIALALWLVRESFIDVAFGYLAGYFPLMFIREIVTLRDTFFLGRLTSAGNGREEKSA